MDDVHPCFSFWLLLSLSIPDQTRINFDQDKTGAPPASITTALIGQGKPGVWLGVKDDNAQANALTQTNAASANPSHPKVMATISHVR